jgi:hypothetical protein
MKKNSDFARLRFAPVLLMVAILFLPGCGTKPPGITFDPPKPVINPTVNLSVNPGTVAPGQSATITWSATGAASCKAVGAWTGTQGMTGSINVNLASPAAQTYTLQCDSNSGGFAERSVILSVSSSAGLCSAKAIRAGGKRALRSHGAAGGHS